MNGKNPWAFVILSLTILILVSTTGCIDIHSTKKMFFPGEEKEITFIVGTISEVRHNFTGGFGENVQVLTQEEHFSVDNFFIGRGSGDLYIYGQIHFGADTERRVDFTRTIDISLYFIPEDNRPVLKAHRTYTAPEIGRFDAAEIIDQIDGAETGLWSLRVIGNGTASSTADVPFYDWYQVSVNGRYSSDSYNNNAPHSTRDN